MPAAAVVLVGRFLFLLHGPLPFAFGPSAVADGALGTMVEAGQTVGAPSLPLRSLVGKANVANGTNLGATPATVAGFGRAEAVVAAEEAVEQRAEHLALQPRHSARHYVSHSARPPIDGGG